VRISNFNMNALAAALIWLAAKLTKGKQTFKADKPKKPKEKR